MWPAIIGGAASIIGGLFNKSSQDSANAQNAANAARQEALQREFAQSGIQWKVEDARKAGIHPLYALGAQTTSYSPVSVGASADTSLGSGIASAGQDFSRAIEATRSRDARSEQAGRILQALSVDKAGLENDLLRAQIAKMRGQVGPAMPSLTDDNLIDGQPSTKRTVVLPGNIAVPTDPNESKQDDISKEYGDEGLPQIPGQYRFARDYLAAAWEYVRRQHTNPKVWGNLPWLRAREAEVYRGALSDKQRRANWRNRYRW